MSWVCSFRRKEGSERSDQFVKVSEGLVSNEWGQIVLSSREAMGTN